jgi:PKD repeat protein
MKHLLTILFLLLSSMAFSQTTNTVTLDGSGSTDPDGTIVKYKWVQTSGTTTPIVNSDSAKATVVYTIPGIYVYSLTVTDNSGATATGSTQVTVLPPNQLPHAVIVPKITIQLP